MQILRRKKISEILFKNLSLTPRPSLNGEEQAGPFFADGN